MKRFILFAWCFVLVACAAYASNTSPLRVFIRAGVKTHGPDQHDHPRFLKEWTELLNERGAKATGAMDFPTAEQLADTDVLILYAADAGDISPEQRSYLDKFLKRGGGLVVLHDAVCGKDADWFKTVIGGAWAYGHAKFYEGHISLYYQDHEHPITRDASNFEFDDEEYYDLEMMPEAHVLANAYQPDDRNKSDGVVRPSVYDVAPQIWTYEKDNYRAFVSIPGHNYKSFQLPHYRAVLLRGIAWAGKRDADLLVSKEELASLRYPVGGPTAPEEASKKINVPPDFNISLVASEPLIEKPISMDWDAKGRLWIAETPEYPFRKDRSRAPYDRISILEDSHHDGHMDKKSVFCNDLDLVTSLVFYKDGVIVSQAPYILWLRDTHGSGHADEKITLYRGFGTNDTHAVISNLRWGMDGWIYATLGYTRGDIYSGDGKQHFGRVTEGVIRFKPDGSAMEQVSSKGGNTWGVDQAPDGEIFFSQANGSHVNHVVMPESALARGRVGNATSFLNIEDHTRSFPLMSWKQQAYVQIDWVGNFTAAAGCCIYDGGAWPEKYDYTYYVSEPTLNIVHQDYLRAKGVSYVASKDPQRLETEFITSSDLWFRPIHERVGPDGALYVLDFYNQAVVHNDTRGVRADPHSNSANRPDRDHHFGRIWRVQNNDARKLEVPKLSGAKPAKLVEALNHPNEWVRMTALRLLLERNRSDIAPQLQALTQSTQASPITRVHALWLLNDLGVETPAILAAAISSTNEAIAKNGLEMIESAKNKVTADGAVTAAAIGRVNDTNARVRLEAIIAAGELSRRSDDQIKTLVRVYPQLQDSWLESAWLGASASEPQRFIATAVQIADEGDFTTLVGNLAAQMGESQDAAAAAQTVILISSASGVRADGLKQAVLENLARTLKPDAVPSWTPELESALQVLLKSPNRELAMFALPLAARWDTHGALAGQVKPLVVELIAGLNNTSKSEGQRVQIATSLLAARQLDAEILPAVARLLGSANSAAFQRQIIFALGNVSDSSVGAAFTSAYAQIPAELQDVVLNELLKRADWSEALLDAIEANKISLATLGPVTINNLRTHSDHAVAVRANKIIDTLRGPQMKEKNELIAKFTPLVTQPGDPARGKELFTKNCAICHSFNGQGKNVAPDLTGMGAHGPAELIVHVLDPNREVEPNYYAYSIETRDGEIYDGVIARENRNSVTLRNAAGDTEISVANIKTRRNTGRSLMPDGFESLGGDVLRDILAYLCAGDARFRILDLRPAFTEDSRRGMWLAEANSEDALMFKKFGLIKELDVPFEIVNPQKVGNGKNVIVLKGGDGFAKTQPQRVEIPNVNMRAGRLHFLGGVAGWGYPIGEDTLKGVPVVKVTVHFSDQPEEEIILKNGVEYADWIGQQDVPGSQPAGDLVKRGQVRWFTKSFKHEGMIQSITLESFDNQVSPAIVAITAEAGLGQPAAAVEPAAHADFQWQPGTKHVLIVGGGSSHDFNKWYKSVDAATLAASGKFSVNYTDKLDDVLPTLKNVDVLFWTSNQAMDDAALQQGIFDFANAGHGLVLAHPGLWYNWKNWPEYNRVLVGGGAHGHDKYGEFEVDVTQPANPLMANVPATFHVNDELYHSEIDPQATPIEVLAEAKNLATGKTFPSVWIVKHPKARIVGIALGHDGGSHDLAPYKTILQNAVAWAAGE
ncbi:MAG TPA: PVC-type heme-binding CxxCH protein [Verrucomicrobiae bacterium]|jgi:putative membrane-bound dehydrogenase-like protein|nr:PVC-type heme-binding CxxCH protein [Verrucomicrobiae bacterium]